MTWEKVYWEPLPIWKSQTAFILGGGPSLREFNAECLRSEKVMVLNSSYLLAPWAEVLFFMDTLWSEKHVDLIKKWPGLVVTTALGAKRVLPTIIKRVQVHLEPNFLHNPKWIRTGCSSGHAGIGLAIAMGATTVVLLGYDMRFVEGRTHHHDEHTMSDEKLFARTFIPAFKGWDDQAKKAGVRILNATPDSALDEFEKIDLQDFLSTSSVAA